MHLRIEQEVIVVYRDEPHAARVRRIHEDGTATVFVATEDYTGRLTYPISEVYVSGRHYEAGRRVERHRAAELKAKQRVVDAAVRWDAAGSVTEQPCARALRKALRALWEVRRKLTRAELREQRYAALDGIGNVPPRAR